MGWLVLMSASAVEAVLFDLDGTLCRFVQSSEALLADSFDAIDVEPFFTVEEYQDRYSEYLGRSESVEALRANCFADLAAERGVDPALGRELAASYSSLRDYSVELLPGAYPVLTELHETYPLGIVTNGRPSLQKPKLQSLEIRDFFDVVVFGGHDTNPKPDAEPFHRALDGLGVEPESTVHIGDTISSDIAGARAAGISSVWLADDATAAPDPTPDYVLASLRDLIPPPW